MIFSMRDIDVLRLLCWCQNILPQDLRRISTEVERENLMTLGFIKFHERSGTLILTNRGRVFLEAALAGAVPNLSLSYADPGYATVYKVTDSVLTKLFGHVPGLYEPPYTQFLTEKGDVINAPPIKALGKAGGSCRK